MYPSPSHTEAQLPLHTGAPPHRRLNWGKVVFVNALLTRQYDVFLSDLDTVWLKDAHRSMMMVLDKYDADVVSAETRSQGKDNCADRMDGSSRRRALRRRVGLGIGQLYAKGWGCGSRIGLNGQG